MGGSGTTQLRRALARTGLAVHDKPDIVYHRYWVKQGKAARLAEFARRTEGFLVDPALGLAAVRDYLRRVAGAPATTAVLSTWAEQHLLRHCDTGPVVFVLREPTAAYRSMCEPHRHGDIASGYGGANSWYAFFYAERWRKTAEEYLALEDAGRDVALWPYEELGEHARRAGHGGIATDWDPKPPRTSPALSAETADLIKAITAQVRRTLGVRSWE